MPAPVKKYNSSTRKYQKSTRRTKRNIGKSSVVTKLSSKDSEKDKNKDDIDNETLEENDESCTIM
jgi:hypothetical protein